MPDLDAGQLLHQATEPLRREIEVLQDLAERERRLQRELGARLVAPVDAVFDLLLQTGSMLQRQAEALETAGAAIAETAALMKAQAELFERTVGTIRQPVELMKSAAHFDRGR
jgi:predicted amidophosphoribosyltransferase